MTAIISPFRHYCTQPNPCGIPLSAGAVVMLVERVTVTVDGKMVYLCDSIEEAEEYCTRKGLTIASA